MPGRPILCLVQTENVVERRLVCNRQLKAFSAETATREDNRELLPLSPYRWASVLFLAERLMPNRTKRSQEFIPQARFFGVASCGVALVLVIVGVELVSAEHN